MKKIFSTSAVLATTLSAMFMASCSDTNLYDATAALKSTIADYEANWVDTYGEIDEEQDWNMATRATATISITEDALSAYTLNLYTANPLKAESSYLLASYDVTTNSLGYAQKSFGVDIPDGTTSVFVGRLNASGKLLVQEVDVVDNTITADFGTSSTAKGQMITRSSSEYYIPEFSSTITTTEQAEAYVADMFQLDWDTSLTTVWSYFDSNYNVLDGWSADAAYSGYQLNAAWDNIVNNYDGKVVVRLGDGDALPQFGSYYGLSGLISNISEIVFLVEAGATVENTNQSPINFGEGTSWGTTVDKISIIVEEGGTLNITSSTYMAIGEATMYVCQDATVTGTGINFGDSALSGASITDTDDCAVGLYNAGTITVENMWMACTKLDNAGTITVDGEIQNSAYTRIINNGSVTCDTYGCGNDDGQVWTNCSFVCKTLFRSYNAKIGDYASIVSPYVEIYGKLYLNYEAVVYAETQILIGNCDIYGPLTSGYHALCGGNDLYYYCNTDAGSMASFVGNVIFAYDTIALGRSERDTWISVVETIFEESQEAGYCSHLITPLSDAVNISSNSDDCSAGVSINEDNIPDEDEEEEEEDPEEDTDDTGDDEEEEETTPETEDTDDTDDGDDTGDDETEEEEEEEEEEVVSAMTWTVACEDLGSTDDYDFNDIVFKIEYVAGSTTATVTPLAAGGTYEAYLTYDGTILVSPSGYSELHKWLESGSASTYYEDDVLRYQPVNATAYDRKAESLEVTVGSDFSVTDNMGGFNLIVYTYSDGVDAVTITAPKTGSVPQMFLVNGLWAWPKERVTIDDAYPNFTNWNSSVTATDWAEYQVSGMCAWNY